jgi:hypothetical protein
MLAIIFLFVFIFNLVPVFMPPTWAVLAYFEVAYHLPVFLLALTGAVAATLGRLLLARLATWFIRDRFLSPKTIKNLDTIKQKLQQHRKISFGIFLFYAFSPFPSNQLFLAYGLTDLDLKLIAVPFFLGRLVSYSFWIYTSSAVQKRALATSLAHGGYFKLYFVLTQILTIVVVYAFTKIDWHKLLTEKKLGWIKKD